LFSAPWISISPGCGNCTSAAAMRRLVGVVEKECAGVLGNLTGA
jgi:hypothetical protein